MTDNQNYHVEVRSYAGTVEHHGWHENNPIEENKRLREAVEELSLMILRFDNWFRVNDHDIDEALEEK